MNNKNLYIAFLSLLPALANAQTILSVTEAPNQPPRVNVQVDNITLNNTTSALTMPNSKSPRTVVWIEYGDGQFTTTPETGHLFFENSRSNFPLMLVKSTGIYDHGGKPPKHTAKKTTPKIRSTQMMAGNQVFYTSEESVRITTNIFDVLPGDTMMVALSYRKPFAAPNGLYRLLFFYNIEGDVFEPLKPENGYPVQDDFGDRVMVPYIRKHNAEELINPQGLPEPVYAEYRNRFKTGNLVFNVLINDDAPHHIFLTLVPRRGLLPGANVSAGMDAVLITPDNRSSAFNYSSRVVGELASHDPNWQEVYPQCIVLPKKNQEMRHHVHFQNTGLGPAKRVMVKTSLPTGLTGNDIEVTGWSIGGVRNNPNYQLRVNRAAADSVVFEFVYDPNSTRIVLNGAAELPDAPVNAKTMGDIYFTCKAKPGTPNTMTSGTSIYFDDNEAVKTEETKVEFKKCCDCDKDCNKYKSKFMKWLLCKEC
jgi:hypothetical protein